ncbi:hypothetical protein CEP54_004299 [Fusarium duplospermum]|uniref:F-box domain-containing protein n=1 Tax=Fusarium duplospermum TaxID=1325734 RepID=A0A428QIZ3_9HYPO|nr:hypothetical protein CEP54_004299 [Fusarium duplospermum]
MPSAQEFSDELVASFCTIPKITFDKMIPKLPLPQRSTMKRISIKSTLGLLNRLPFDVLVQVLKLLDFQSLSRLSRTSLRGQFVVEALRVYREVMRYYPRILAALGKTDLLRHHSCVLVRQVLSEQKCASCFGYGGILFLPTCERICRDCLEKNYAYHLTDVAYAEEWFSLTNEQLQRIPIMRSIPGEYRLRCHAEHFESHQLVSIKQLLQLAIKVHGSPEKVAELLPPRSSMTVYDEEMGADLSYGEWELLEEFHKAPLEPPGRDLSKLKFNYLVYDKYPGMASIHVPHVTRSGRLEGGYQCRGCRHAMYKYYSLRVVQLPTQGYDFPEGVAPGTVFRAMAVRLRGWKDFKDHVRQCDGVRRLLGGEKEETDWSDVLR